MKRKILYILLAVMTFFSSLTSAGALSTSSINNSIEKILNIPADERQSYITLLVPLLMVDSGVDSLASMIEKYDAGGNNGYMGEYIGKLLTFTDKETLLNLLETIKCIKVEERQDFLDKIKTKKPLNISEEARESLNELLQMTYIEIPALKKLNQEDGIDAAVAANFIKSLYEINGYAPALAFDAKGNTFLPCEIDGEFADKINAVWQEYLFTENGIEKNDGTLTGVPFNINILAANYAEKLMENIPAADRSNIANALKETGILVFKETAVPDKRPLELVKDWQQSDIMIEITNEMLNNLISLDTAYSRPVLYKREGDKLIPVKYAALSDGVMICRLSESGSYTIRDAVPAFSDCDGWAKDYIEALYARGIVNGRDTGIFMPQAQIKREEFVKLIVELLDLEQDIEAASFSDVDKNAWYAGFVGAAYKNHIIDGYDKDTFGIGDNIKRQDMAKIINTVLKEKGASFAPAASDVMADFDMVDDYAKDHVLSIYGAGIIGGDDTGRFNPKSFATRAESAKMIYGMLIELIKIGA